MFYQKNNARIRDSVILIVLCELLILRQAQGLIAGKTSIIPIFSTTPKKTTIQNNLNSDAYNAINKIQMQQIPFFSSGNNEKRPAFFVSMLNIVVSYIISLVLFTTMQCYAISVTNNNYEIVTAIEQGHDHQHLSNSFFTSSQLVTLEETTNTKVFPYTQYLKAPTEEQPQIMLPTNIPLKTTTSSSSSSSKPQPILQGLITSSPGYYKNPDDILVITATSPSSSKTVIGAKISMDQIRFPMKFNLYDKNLIGQVDETILQQEDLFVNVKVCPSYPCSETESVVKGRGIAKIIRGLPGLPNDETIRASASILLE